MLHLTLYYSDQCWKKDAIPLKDIIMKQRGLKGISLCVQSQHLTLSNLNHESSVQEPHIRKSKSPELRREGSLSLC